jgi:hypothetical protein
MPTYLVRLYSPYTLKPFAKRIDAPTAEEAKKKVVGSIIRDPDGYEFQVEPYYIISVAPITVFPKPPYELMDEEEVKEAEWLKGAIITEPLAKGSTPVGSPKLETEIPNSFTTVFFGQEVKSRSIRFLEDYPKFKVGIKEYGPYKRGDVEHKLPWSKAKELCAVKFRVLKSPPLTPLIDPTGRALREGEEVTYSEPEHLAWAKLQVQKGNLQQITEPVAEWLYPEYKTKVRYKIDIFTKFLEEAKRMRRADKIKEAVEYLITYSMGIPLEYLAQILDIGYWTAWRAVAELARPTETMLKRLMETLDETASLEKWTKGQEEEIILTLKTPKEPKIGLGYWHNRVICYPLKPLPETALLNELKRILTLEGYPTLSKEEEEALEKQMREYYEKKARERLTYWLK